jgi:hypothetical protein
VLAFAPVLFQPFFAARWRWGKIYDVHDHGFQMTDAWEPRFIYMWGLVIWKHLGFLWRLVSVAAGAKRRFAWSVVGTVASTVDRSIGARM